MSFISDAEMKSIEISEAYHMYKLLLVDDEQIIREGIERMIDWNRLNITLTRPAPMQSPHWTA